MLSYNFEILMEKSHRVDGKSLIQIGKLFFLADQGLGYLCTVLCQKCFSDFVFGENN